MRLLNQMELSPCFNLDVVGMEEWTWRKGYRYGAIVFDLEIGHPVELLPDARADVPAEWLRVRPSTEVV